MHEILSCIIDLFRNSLFYLKTVMLGPVPAKAGIVSASNNANYGLKTSSLYSYANPLRSRNKFGMTVAGSIAFINNDLFESNLCCY